MVMTSLDIEDAEYNVIKRYCKEHGYTLKGLLLTGAKMIMKEKEAKE